MMLPAIALALTTVTTQDVSGPMKRLEGFFAKHPSFHAKMKFQMSTGEQGTGILFENRPSKIAFVLKFKNSTYQFVRTPLGVIETSSGRQAYDEYPSEGRIDVPRSDFASHDWRLQWPIPLFVTELTEYFPSMPVLAYDGASKVNGAPVDVVSIKLNNHHMKYSAKMSIDDSGKIVRYVTDDPNGRFKVTVDVTDYELDKLPATAFKLATLPKGYTLQELPEARQPLAIDQKLPSSSVVDSAGSSHSLSALVGKTGLLVVVDAAWPNSPWGKKAISDIRTILQNEKGGDLILLNDTAGKSGAKGNLYADPSGAALTTLSIPGSPSFFLTNKQGVIERIWCGYHPDDIRFTAELKDAIRRPGESRPDR